MSNDNYYSDLANYTNHCLQETPGACSVITDCLSVETIVFIEVKLQKNYYTAVLTNLRGLLLLKRAA